jgi:hypothetical protein
VLRSKRLLGVVQLFKGEEKETGTFPSSTSISGFETCQVVQRAWLNPTPDGEDNQGNAEGLLYIRQNRAGTIPILARLMNIQEEMAAKIYDLVLPGLTADGTLNPELQKKVLEFVFKVQGIKEPAVAEKIYDFGPVRKIRADLEAKKWKPAP